MYGQKDRGKKLERLNIIIISFNEYIIKYISINILLIFYCLYNILIQKYCFCGYLDFIILFFLQKINLYQHT